MSKKILRSVISTFFSFVSSVMLALTTICIIICATILNPNYMSHHLEKSGFYDRLLEILNTHFISEGIPGGFDEEVMKNLLGLDQLKYDIGQYTDIIFSDKESNPVAVGVYENIYNKLEENLKSRNIEITQEQKESIEYIAKDCARAYIGVVKFPYIKQLQSVFLKIRNPLIVALFILLFVALLMVLFIFLINPKDKRSSIKYVIYALTACLFYNIFIVIALFNYHVERISLYEAFYYFFVSYAKGIFLSFIIAAVVILVLTGACFLLYRKWDPNKYQESHLA